MSNGENAEHFIEYFAARRDAVRRTAYLLCGDWHWADDLTQEAFVRLFSAWGQVRDPAALDAYVRTCLVRVYLSESRRVWRRRERSWEHPPEVGQDDQTDQVGLRDAFVAALRTLPPRQRATLVCRYYQGLDIEQTAELLGCSGGTVKTQASRGLAALRRQLGTQFEVSLNEVTS